MVSERDIVGEARILLSAPDMEPFIFGATRDVMNALADEVERLRRHDVMRFAPTVRYLTEENQKLAKKCDQLKEDLRILTKGRFIQS